MRAISSMATRGVLADLADAAASSGLPRVDLESVGGVEAAARVAAGEPFDLVFLAEDALVRLAGAGHVDAGSIQPIVLSQVGVAVPDAAAEGVDPGRIAFADAAGVQRALLEAGRIGYSTGPSGTALLSMVADWGLADDLAGRLVQARPGHPVARLVADGLVDLGFQQLSELVGQPGIRVLGVLPDDCAIETVFAGAVAAKARQPEAARNVLAFFASPATRDIKRRHAFGVR